MSYKITYNYVKGEGFIKDIHNTSDENYIRYEYNSNDLCGKYRKKTSFNTLNPTSTNYNTPKADTDAKGDTGPQGSALNSFIFKQQSQFNIGPIQTNHPINIPTIFNSSDIKNDPLGSIIISNPGIYVAIWSLPAKVTFNPTLAELNIIVTLNNITTGDILSKSCIVVNDDLAHTLVGTCIFSTSSNDNILQLLNYSNQNILIPIQGGAGINPIGAGANMILFRIN